LAHPFDVTDSQLGLSVGGSALDAPAVSPSDAPGFAFKRPPASPLPAATPGRVDQLVLPLGESMLGALQAIAPPRPHRIYCNRNLRLDHVQMIGFDMDYTLAIYNQDEMDRLSIEATARKLVERGYPASLLTMTYQPHFPIRGLLVDKKLGNVLKMDRYYHVGRVYHGRRRLSKEERIELYRKQKIRPGSSRYAWVDTLFSLPEVALYADLVDLLEGRGARSLDYEALYEAALALARARAAEFREGERTAAAELERLAAALDAPDQEALAAARDRCQEALLNELEGDAEAVLAHRLLQLALAPVELS
jgi:hypothetical protein